ncbi:MAG: GNAT family N-acetyltransferase [Exilispira sp.]|jgi:ribosomal protein S18 acetylase RimI-like enzyme|nr:GNAT family N-acetyltransferase [Exilispira sp.]
MMVVNDFLDMFPVHYESYPIEILYRDSLVGKIDWLEDSVKKDILNRCTPKNADIENVFKIFNETACALAIYETYKIIGVVYMFDMDFSKMEIGNIKIYIENSHQKRGIGSGVIEYLSDCLKNYDIKKLTTYIDKNNPSAIACFTKVGFESVGDKYEKKL